MIKKSISKNLEKIYIGEKMYAGDRQGLREGVKRNRQRIN